MGWISPYRVWIDNLFVKWAIGLQNVNNFPMNHEIGGNSFSLITQNQFH